MDDSSEDPQPAIQVIVDSSTISGPCVCETLAHQQIVDDSVRNVLLDDSSLVEDNNTQHSVSLTEEDNSTHYLYASNSLDDVPSAEGTSTVASNSLNESVLVTDNPLHHATPLDESLDTTVGSLDTTISSLNPAVQSGDFKKVVELMQQRTLTDDEKYYLLTSHFNPDSAYRLPSFEYDKQKCSFQHSWLSCYNGLVYSECGKGGYCKYCVLFGKAAYSM